MGETMIRFLESLVEPVVPFDYYGDVLDVKDFAQARR